MNQNNYELLVAAVKYGLPAINDELLKSLNDVIVRANKWSRHEYELSLTEQKSEQVQTER